MISFDKPLLPPMPGRGEVPRQLPIEFWLASYKIEPPEFITQIEVSLQTKKGFINAVLTLCTSKFFLSYTKDINKACEYPYTQVSACGIQVLAHDSKNDERELLKHHPGVLQDR